MSEIRTPITETMPVFFIGHGNPMNAIQDNPFTRSLAAMGRFRCAEAESHPCRLGALAHTGNVREYNSEA